MTITPDIYINAASMVCCRENPLTDRSPLCGYHRAVEPDTRGILKPMEARRLSRILRRAIYTSRMVAPDGADAVITATAMGCWENSERFLADIRDGGEQLLKPTLFMQSTHNTPGAVIAINTGCHGYNNTWSQGAMSFESALLDAAMTLDEEPESDTVIVGAHDELTPVEAEIMVRGGIVDGFVSEASVSLLLSRHPGVCACRFDSMEIVRAAEFAGAECDMLVIANASADTVAGRITSRRVIRCQEIVGHTMTPSAAAVYMAYRYLTDGEARNALIATGDCDMLSLIRLSKI